jgi:1,4-dihydroxy-2-naphthoate polyprenyltransferase
VGPTPFRLKGPKGASGCSCELPSHSPSARRSVRTLGLVFATVAHIPVMPPPRVRRTTSKPQSSQYKLSQWLLAARPKTLGAAIVPFLVGSALAHRSGHLAWHLVLPAFPALLLIQVGTNLVNDAVDFQRGADTAERLGPLRVTQAGIFKASTVHAAGVGCFALAALCIAPAMLARGWRLVAVYVSSSLAGYGYTGGPWPFAYSGLGDIVVVGFFGIVATAGVRFIHTGGVLFDRPTIAAGLQIGCLAAELLAVNNIRDVAGDSKVGKRTLAVRFGLTFARVEVALLAAFTFALGIAQWPRLGMQRAATWPLIVSPSYALLVWRVAITQPSREYNKLLILAAIGHMLFGIVLTVAIAT